ALAPGDAAGSALAPGAAGTVPSGAVPAPLPGNSVLGSQLATGTAATGTPLSSRAPEPGVTCRVVK
ncbi:MAG TPA: hypothetical protein VII33_10070, partial [Nakamurella sp.]